MQSWMWLATVFVLGTVIGPFIFGVAINLATPWFERQIRDWRTNRAFKKDGKQRDRLKAEISRLEAELEDLANYGQNPADLTDQILLALLRLVVWVVLTIAISIPPLAMAISAAYAAIINCGECTLGGTISVHSLIVAILFGLGMLWMAVVYLSLSAERKYTQIKRHLADEHYAASLEELAGRMRAELVTLESKLNRAV